MNRLPFEGKGSCGGGKGGRMEERKAKKRENEKTGRRGSEVMVFPCGFRFKVASQLSVVDIIRLDLWSKTEIYRQTPNLCDALET